MLFYLFIAYLYSTLEQRFLNFLCAQPYCNNIQTYVFSGGYIHRVIAADGMCAQCGSPRQESQAHSRRKVLDFSFIGWGIVTQEGILLVHLL